jgi:uncharacterized protein (TIGR02466 family)
MSESKKEIKTSTVPEVFTYFPTLIYTFKKPEFLEIAQTVCEEYVKQTKEQQKELNEIYPVYMTDSFYNDPRISELSKFIGETSWNILNDQGYNMSSFNVQFSEMWCQQHYKHSSMEQHTHKFGSQIVGFYFTKTPEECSRVVFHDPRIAKTMIDLPETDISMASAVSNMINFKPEPGMLIFTNAWLAHSFTRHAEEDPIQFIHFNLNVVPAGNHICESAAEII